VTIGLLAFQSIGVIYGDIGTSPLYVYASTYVLNKTDSNGNTIPALHDDILGTLCLIIYTLTLVPLIKYCYIVLRANDNGNGASPPPHPLQPGCSTTLRKINSRSTNNALQLKGREKNWCKKGELMGEW
jgi:hypothetical protein